jgi:serine/threonine protein kinase
LIVVGSESEDDDHLINGRYRLVEVVGRGGMGTVWHGHDEMLDREVAIKQIRLAPDLTDEERSLIGERAMREARATAGLSHPGIITVFDVIEHDGAPMIVMEYIRGRSLAALIKENVRLPWRRVAGIGAQMLAVLREAHAAGVVHRDLKPANVLLVGERAVITDFGIAHRSGETTISEPGEVVGTPAFMAPEQAEQAATTPASDLWSLGATLFAAVEGRPPYIGPDFVTTLLNLLTQAPAEPRNAGPLGPVIGSLLRKDPTRRATAEQTAAALDAILHPAAPAPAPAPPPPAVRPAPAPSSQASNPPPKPHPTPKARQSGAPAPHHHASPPVRRQRPRRLTSAMRTGLLFLGALALVGGVATIMVESDSSSGDPAGAATPLARAPSHPAPRATPLPDLAGSDRNYTSAMAVNPAGTTVATATANGSVRLWNTADHKLIGTLATGADALAFSPDGSSLAVDDGSRVELWSIATRHKEQGIPDSSVVMSMAFGPDGRTIVLGSTAYGDAMVGTWRIGTTSVSETTIDYPCNELVLSPDGATLACGIATISDTSFVLWDVAAHRTIETVPWSSSDNDIYALDGDELATADDGGRIGVSKFRTHRPVGAALDDAAVVEMAFGSRDELYDLDQNGLLHVWNVTTGRQITRWSATA